jgi:putative ABC transport system ATP-binding protein
MTTFRRENIGYIFQFFNLLQDLTVLENILLIQELSGGRDEKRARELLLLVGLEDEIERFPTEISGGQQQRVAIARSLAKSPKLLLGDELTGNLDSTTSAMVMEVLVEACKTENITTVMVSHDESLSKYANRVIRLDSGRIVADDNL